MSTPVRYTQRQLDAKIRESLTAYIVTCAAQYSHGAWSGCDVAGDMLRSAGIKPHEIREHESDPYRRKRLIGMLK